MSPARVLQLSTTQPLAEPQLVLVIANDSESHSGREVNWTLRIAVTAQPWKPAPTHVMTRRATCKYDDTRTRSCGSLYLHTRRSVCGLRACKCNYELRFISRDSFDTTRSIWTFVTNQRRILDDNAPKNSRSENQLVVVKIPPWLFAVLVQKGHHKVKNTSESEHTAIVCWRSYATCTRPRTIHL